MIEKFFNPKGLSSRLGLVEELTQFSCGRSALRVCYSQLGHKYSEAGINLDLSVGPDDCLSWDHMIAHPRMLGLNTSLYTGNGFESLLIAHYDPAIMVIVGWTPYIVADSNKFHFCPVRRVSPGTIQLVDSSFGQIVTFSRREFIEQWYDTEYSRGFMTIGIPERK